MAVVVGLEGRVAERPVREELAENVLEEELVELEELDELEESPKGEFSEARYSAAWDTRPRNG